MQPDTDRRVTILETQRQSCIARIDTLEDVVFGNGKPGLKQEVTMINTALKALETKRGQNTLLIVALIGAAGSIVTTAMNLWR